MGKKAQTVQPQQAQSQFSGVNNYTVGLDGFGNSTSNKNGDTISTNTSFSPQMQGLQQGAYTGLQNNQNFLNQSPTQQYQDLLAGNNPFYNAMHAQNMLNNQNQYNDLQSRMSQSGMENSTTMGGFAGQQARDANLLDLTTQAQALDQQNQLAGQNFGINSGMLQQLYGYGSGLQNLSNQDLMQGFQNADQTAMFNAQQRSSADQFNAQQQAQAAARQQALWGNIAGAGLSLAAIPLAGAFGPAAAISKGLMGANAGLQGLNTLGFSPGGYSPGMSLGNPSGYNSMFLGRQF
jgi:hypothetical protein